MEEWVESGNILSRQDVLQPPSAVILDEVASEPFVGQWQQLISHTNWEKGRILNAWRSTLESAGAPASAYSDEAWSRLVGGVTPQHVGRLRRVAQRFGDCYDQYSAIYWSHFFAALEWPDAEMWLEGAVQNRWSVAAMRRTRAETLGELADESPLEPPALVEPDEDFEPLVGVAEANGTAVDSAPEQLSLETVPRSGGAEVLDDFPGGEVVSQEDDDVVAAAPVRPFADLADLPDDLAEAFDQFKLAILAHKTRQWRDVACADVLAALEALKSLAIAP